MRRERARVAEHDDPERFRKLGVEVIFGTALVTAPGEVRVADRSLAASHIVVATGAGPSVPPIEGLEAAGYLTYADAFDQDELPPRIAILGGGPIGIEFAQIYSRLGARVTVLEQLPRILAQEEPDASSALREALAAEGIDIRTEAAVTTVRAGTAGGKVVHATTPEGTSELVVDEVFVATGRRAHGAGIGLEEIGVGLDAGAVVVDRKLESAVSGIWAAGDVAGGPQFTHVAEYQAKLVLRNALFPFSSAADYSLVPSVTYTDPEVARVGLTESEARDRYGSVDCYQYEFADLDRAIVDGRTRGFTRIVTRRGGRIVGATIVGSHAGDLLAPILLAMRRGVRLKALSSIIYPYPTMSEGVKRTADLYYRGMAAGRSGALLKRVVRWLN